MWLLSAFFAAVFLIVIILSVPLAFDVGGQACGLAFSLSLVSFYFLLSLLRVTTPARSRVRNLLVALIRWGQWFLISALLIWSLNRFSADTEASASAKASASSSSQSRLSSLPWLQRLVSQGPTTGEVSWNDYVFGPNGLLETVILGSWDRALRWSSPFFQLAEGFCSLLVIQASGQVTRWVVNRSQRPDSWMIGLLALSGSIISSSVYFLWRVLHFPQISNLDSALIGVAVTCAVFLCAWAIGSGRGNPVESSFLFAYIVLCIYQIFTDYQASSFLQSSSSSSSTSAAFPPLPPIIMESYSTLSHVLSTLPSIIQAGFNGIYAAFSAISSSVLISLAYRLLIFYAATRVIPAIRRASANVFSNSGSSEDLDGPNRLFMFLSWFSPSILIAVYTSLLLQHFTVISEADSMSGHEDSLYSLITGPRGSIFWRWINLALTVVLYAVEIAMGKDQADFSDHWKTE